MQYVISCCFHLKKILSNIGSGLDFVVQPFKVSLEFCNCSESFITNITRNCSHQYVTELIMKIVVCVTVMEKSLSDRPFLVLN